VGAKGLSKDGNWGRASLASKEKGEQIQKAHVDGIFHYVRETFRKLEELERAAPRKSIIPNH